MKCRNSRLEEAEKSGREILPVCGCRKSPSHSPVKLFDGAFFCPNFLPFASTSPLMPVTRSSAAPEVQRRCTVMKVMFSNVSNVMFFSVTKVMFLPVYKVMSDQQTIPVTRSSAAPIRL
jgi:hypothetical protein